MKITVTIDGVKVNGEIPQDEVGRAFGSVMRERGYVVIGTLPNSIPYAIGAQINQVFQYHTKNTFVVTERTEKDDLLAQYAMLQEQNPSWRRRTFSIPNGATFYRIVPLALVQQHKLTRARTLLPRCAQTKTSLPSRNRKAR